MVHDNAAREKVFGKERIDTVIADGRLKIKTERIYFMAQALKEEYQRALDKHFCMKFKNMAAAVLGLSILASILFPGTVSAKTAKSKRWAEAYMETVRALNKEDKKRKAEYTSEFMPYQAYTYALIYFDQDNIPELVAGTDGYWVSMYTYDPDEGKVYTVMDQWGYGAMGNAGYEYLPKKNCLRNYNSDFAGAVMYTHYAKMKNHEIVSRRELKQQFFTDKNRNHMPDEDEYTDQPSCYCDGKKISAEKFQSYLIPGKFKEIKGTMTYRNIKKKLRYYIS